jgi:hypothetical protein
MGRLPQVCGATCHNSRQMGDSDAPRPAVRPITPVKSALTTPPAGEPKVLCDRCGGEVYRMHAVWRCAACGFKSDCCGW